jgi:hypothetical protein
MKKIANIKEINKFTISASPNILVFFRIAYTTIKTKRKEAMGKSNTKGGGIFILL